MLECNNNLPANTANENQSHFVDTHHNQDKVFKESFDLFKGNTLEFLDAELNGEVSDILSTEVTETTTKKAYGDNALRLTTNKGVCTEWEADIDSDDIMRFASYNIDFSRKHKIPFTTVIITTKTPSVAVYENPSLLFKPKIINLKERDADEVLAEIKRKLTEGEQINELQLIYLPLYGSKSGKTTVELLDTAIKLTPDVAKNDKEKRNKLQSLMILLNSTFVTNEELYYIWEVNRMLLEENRAVRVLTEIGRKEGIIKIALNMLRRGRDIKEIAEDTGLSVAEIIKLQDDRLATA
jgi:hypothetical protein